MDAERFYDRIAEGYLSTFKTKSMARVMGVEQELVLSHLPLSRKPFVLEIGTGPGRLSSEIVKRDLCFTGIDISEEMLRACRQRIGPEPNLLQLDVSKGLPFPDESFDYIYSIRVLKYVHNFPQILNDIYRVLRHGGTFLFSMPNKLSINALQMRQHLEYHRYNISRLKEMVKYCGFASVNVVTGPKLPDFIYQKESGFWDRLIIKTERGLEDIFSYRLTREPFYVCQKL